MTPRSRARLQFKQRLWMQQQGLCALCGKHVEYPSRIYNHLDGPKRPNLDHKLPRSLGGKEQKKNLQLTHYECNERRGNNMNNVADSEATA